MLKQLIFIAYLYIVLTPFHSVLFSKGHTRPRPVVMTTRTNKTLRPTQVHYIIVTILFCCKPCNKLLKIFWVILMFHNMPPISKYMADILHVVVTGGKRIPSLFQYVMDTGSGLPSTRLGGRYDEFGLFGRPSNP